VHAALQQRAKREGQSLQQYVTRELTRIAQRSSLGEVLDRIERRAGSGSRGVPTLPLPPPPPPPPHPCRLGAASAEPAVPPITAAPKTAAWEQQYALGQRIMFGLPTSPQSIAAAAADPAATTDDLGTPLTPAEHAQLLAADSSGLNLEAVAQAAQAELPASFAGAAYQYGNGGTIYVAFTSQACPSQAQLAQFAHMSGVRTVAVGAANDSTITRLNALQTAVDADTPMLRSQGVLVNRTEVDTPHNQALVTLDPSSVPGAQSIMTKRYGAGLAFAPAAPPAQPLDARYNPPKSKVNGGQDITDGNGRCTANISISEVLQGQLLRDDRRALLYETRLRQPERPQPRQHEGQRRQPIRLHRLQEHRPRRPHPGL